MSEHDELDELVIGHQAGELDAAGQERLEALLREPANRQRFVAQTLLSVALIRAPAAAQAAAAPAPAPRASVIKGRFGLALVGTALAAGVAAAIVLHLTAGPTAAPTAVIGSLADAEAGTIIKRAGGELPAVPGAEVRDGDELVGAASVRWSGEDTTVAVRAGGEAVLRATPAGKRIELRLGEVAAEVAHQPAGRPLIVDAPEGQATVVGTRFTYAREAGGARLAVTQGLVRLRRHADNAEVDVPAGKAAVAAPAPPWSDLHRDPIEWRWWRAGGRLPIWQLPAGAEIDAPAQAAGGPEPTEALLITGAPLNLAKRSGELRFTFAGPVSAEGWKLEVIASRAADEAAGSEPVAWEVEPRDRARTDLSRGAHAVRMIVSNRDWRVLVDGEPVARFTYTDDIAAGGMLHLGLRATARAGTAPLALATLVAGYDDEFSDPAP